MRKACYQAGVKASSHGLRKWAAAKLAEEGGSEMELQAKFGWKSQEQSSVYTRSANRKRLALQAAKRTQEEHETPHLDAGAGKKLKK